MRKDGVPLIGFSQGKAAGLTGMNIDISYLSGQRVVLADLKGAWGYSSHLDDCG